jgi:cytochrome c oxidase subunit I
MLILTMPWHWVGLLGMPRRMAYFDYSNPQLRDQAWTVTASTIGGALLVVSAFLLVFILLRARRRDAAPQPFTFSRAVHEGAAVPPLLNGFALWVGMMIALTLVNYAFPIAQLATLPETSVPAVHMGEH